MPRFVKRSASKLVYSFCQQAVRCTVNRGQSDRLKIIPVKIYQYRITTVGDIINYMSEDQFTKLFNYMEKRFDIVDKKFEMVDKRFDLLLNSRTKRNLI